MGYAGDFAQNSSYNRQKAVQYALTYGIKPNSDFRFFKLIGNNGGDCTNFISQCLFAGGASMEYRLNQPWWYKKNDAYNTNYDTCSISWSVAHSLYWFLKVRGKFNTNGLRGIEVYDVNLLEPGDLIQVEDQNHIIFHSAIVTAISFGVPFVTQHTANAVNKNYNQMYRGKKHFIKIFI